MVAHDIGAGVDVEFDVRDLTGCQQAEAELEARRAMPETGSRLQEKCSTEP